ncbi:MAG: polysaccharide biosynthesis C-terminal domain-containing protein, partial [Oscillospiraceae bacterium]|nr:polysaccharide biosynthesis C-terminal domain-containing protein [Oscillospiraceae bacterium]
ISLSGIPVALSRLVAAARATGDRAAATRYFQVALPAFAAVGLAFALAMFFASESLAAAMGDRYASYGLRALAPGVFFCCVISVYEGYSQGFGNMAPTAAKQIIEVSCKLLVGLSIAWFLARAGAPSPSVSAGAISGASIGLAAALPVMMLFKRAADRSDALAAQDASRPPARTIGRRAALARVLRVSVPVTLGASFMSIMTVIDTKLVLWRLQHGAGYTESAAQALYGAYAKGQPFLQMPSALIIPFSVSIIPAISAAAAAGRTREARGVMESSLKLACLVAMPAGVGISVLARPIFFALIGQSDEGVGVLSIFGIASVFICLQLITTAMLQANGYERVPMATYPIGGLIQIAIDWALVGDRSFGILGSSFGTLACYLSITVMNLAVIAARVKDRPRYAGVFLRPALCTAVMGVAAFTVYQLLRGVFSDEMYTERIVTVLCLGAAIAAGAAVYLTLVLLTGTITRDDLKSMPRGERIADILRLR